METNQDMRAVIDVAQKSVGLTFIDGFREHEVFFNPLGKGGAGEVVQIARHGDAPARKRGTVTVFDPAAFNQVLRDNEGAGSVAIYIDRNPQAPGVVAVLNGHGKEGPGWGDFRVLIAFRETPQWQRWKAIDGKMMDQIAFAEFIEDNLEDIADPAGATMLEIATALEAKRDVAFRSAVRLASGAIDFQHAENISAQVGPGRIAVPETFTLGIAPLQGSAPYSVPVRFRYRIVEGKLRLGIKLQRVEDLMAKVLEDVIARIERGANVSVLDGLAPAAVVPLG